MVPNLSGFASKLDLLSRYGAGRNVLHLGAVIGEDLRRQNSSGASTTLSDLSTRT